MAISRALSVIAPDYPLSYHDRLKEISPWNLNQPYQFAQLRRIRIGRAERV